MNGIPVHYIYWLLGVCASALGTLIGFFLKQLGKKFDIAFGTLEDIHRITSVQSENHLTTIQNESIKHTALFSDLIREQAETNGFLKAVVERLNR